MTTTMRKALITVKGNSSPILISLADLSIHLVDSKPHVLYGFAEVSSARILSPTVSDMIEAFNA